MSILFATVAVMLSAQVTLDSIARPEGSEVAKNLFSNPTFQAQHEQNGTIADWNNNDSKQITLSWVTEDGSKILRAITSKQGNHLGVQQSLPLKPAMKYQYYVIARGKVGMDSQVQFLYGEGKIKGNKHTFFVGSTDNVKNDFEWTLYTHEFATPDLFPDGSGSFYPVLIWGNVDIEIARAGLIELGTVKNTLAKLDPKFTNLLNNPEFLPDEEGYPLDWNQDFEKVRQFFRFTKESDGKYSVTLLPREESLVLRQGEFLLKSGKKFRIGASIRAKDFHSKRVGLILYNHAWTESVGSGKMPENTFGWKDMEFEITLPKTKFDQFVFAFYTVGSSSGEISIRDPFLKAADDDAAKEVTRPVSMAHLNRITPADPLLFAIDSRNPAITFSFNYLLPDGEKFICSVSTKMGDTKSYGKVHSFPVNGPMIHTTLGNLNTGKGMLNVEIKNEKTGNILASAEYPICVVEPVKMSVQPRRLNMLTQRLLTENAANKNFVFSNPREGWVYIRLSKGQENTTAKLDNDVNPVIIHRAGEPYETTRYLAGGDHTLTLSGSVDGELIVNSIPEIFVYSWPFQPGMNKKVIENYHPEITHKYLIPNMTTFNFGYPFANVPEAKYQDTLNRGKRWFSLGLHLHKADRFESPDELANRLKAAFKRQQTQGIAFDEIAISSITDKWIYTQMLWQMLEEEKPIYTWSSGVTFAINGLNADYFSASANNGQGKGKFLYECYSRTQPNEQQAVEYLQKYLTDSIRRSDKFMPNSARYALIINGGYTSAGNYCTDTFAGPDVKKFWDMFYYKLANEPEFKDLAGVGLYAYNNGSEESLRWVTRLHRHYVLEGNTSSLAEEYDYVYLPGFIKDGDFTEGFKFWTATPAEDGQVEAKIIKGFGRSVQKRMGEQADTGDTVCLFKRSAKAPNRLSCNLTGLKPGQLYALRYVVADHAEVKSKNASGNKHVLRAEISDSENVTANSPAGKYLSTDGIGVNKLVNNVVQVFKPAESEVTLTFTDWQSSEEPGGYPEQELLLNMVRLTPYYAE